MWFPPQPFLCIGAAGGFVLVQKGLCTEIGDDKVLAIAGELALDRAERETEWHLEERGRESE